MCYRRMTLECYPNRFEFRVRTRLNPRYLVFTVPHQVNQRVEAVKAAS